MMEEVEFKMTYKEMRLLLLQRSQYRSKFAKSIRKVFKRLRMKQVYDHGIGVVVELYDFLFCGKKIWMLHRTEMQAIFDTTKNFLPANPTAVLDIGAGFGGIDLVLFHHFDSRPTMYLLDKDVISTKLASGYHGSAESFSPYNSFQYSRAFLERNGVPKDKVKTIDVNKETFPAGIQFDLVTSLLAWGFHFPVSTYIEQVHNSLTLGGSLIMDVRKDTDGMKTIEDVFVNTPIILYEEKKFFRIGVKK